MKYTFWSMCAIVVGVLIWQLWVERGAICALQDGAASIVSKENFEVECEEARVSYQKFMEQREEREQRELELKKEWCKLRKPETFEEFKECKSLNL